MSDQQPQSPLPKWKCHKVVHAAKITGWVRNAFGSYNMQLSDDLAMTMTEEWYRRHAPVIGGYVVQYEDGYTSYSPREAFEAGYTRLESVEPNTLKTDPVKEMKHTDTAFATSRGEVAYTARYDDMNRVVTISGVGRPDQGGRVAVVFPHFITEREHLAFSLGLKILHYLETGDSSVHQDQLLEAAALENQV